MVRRSAALLLFLGLTASAHAAEPDAGSPVPPSSIDEAARKARFTAFVIEGDHARAAGRLTAAAKAYAAALELRKDPLVAGRLGVVIVELGQPADAGDLLLLAIQEAMNASPTERQGFLRAYDTARAQVTWLDVTISQANARLTLDGEPKNQEGFSALAMFVTPGEHELHARLEGYEDAVEIFTARKGQKMNVTLTLKPKAEPLPPPVRLRRDPPRVRFSGLDEPPQDEPEKREPIVGGVDGAQRAEKPRISVAAGPVIVFGVASWQPAVGAVAGVDWRPKEYFSLGIEGRAAWLTSGVKGQPINAMTAGALARACGHWRWFYGCGLGHLGVINVDWQATGYKARSDTLVKPGVGGRIGASVRVTRGFVLGASFDVLGLDRGVKIVAGQTVLVDQPPVMLGVQLSGGWEF